MVVDVKFVKGHAYAFHDWCWHEYAVLLVELWRG